MLRDNYDVTVINERKIEVKFIKKTSLLIAMVLIMCSCFGVTAFAVSDKSQINYDTNYSFNYNVNGKAVKTPAFYSQGIASEKIAPGATDFCLKNGEIYLLHPADKAIYVYDADDLTLKRTVLSDEDLGDAKGIFVTDNNEIYLALYAGKKIIVLDGNGKKLSEIGEPSSDAISDTFEYKPTKVAVQKNGLIYVVSEGAYDGLLQFDSNGKFIGFFGSNKVELSATQLIAQMWNKLFTEEQKDRQEQFLPSNYSSVFCGEDDFIYVCTDSSEITTEQIKKLSPFGNNVLSGKDTLVYGNTETDEKEILNIFCDIAVDENGIMSVLDSMSGRIFQYDTESNLLGVFGGIGEQKGLFEAATAIECENETLYVLDAERGVIYSFEPTEYGKLIHSAILLSNDGNEVEASEKFQKIYSYCEDLDWVNRGLGRAEVIKGNYKNAMKYFKAANDTENYSTCFELYRTEQIGKYFWIIFIGIISVFFVAWIAINRSIKKDTPPLSSNSGKKILPFSLISHPTAFNVMKTEQKGSFVWAVIIVIAVIITRFLSFSSVGFLFAEKDPRLVNYVLEAVQIVILLVCWVLCSWAVGTFLDGKSKVKELFIASGYALLPYCMCGLISVIFSNVFSLREAAFVTGIQIIGLYWSVLLMFLAMMLTNEYSFGKTIISILLTIVALVFVLFVVIMMITLVSKITDFVAQIYEEYMFRF